MHQVQSHYLSLLQYRPPYESCFSSNPINISTIIHKSEWAGEKCPGKFSDPVRYCHQAGATGIIARLQRVTLEHQEKRSGPRKVDCGFQLQLEKDGGGTQNRDAVDGVKWSVVYAALATTRQVESNKV